MEAAPSSYYAPDEHSNRLHPRKNAGSHDSLTRFSFRGESHMSVFRTMLFLVPLAIFCTVLTGAGQATKTAVKPEPFGTMPDGKAVERFTLTNANGVELKAISYGGIITSLRVPDRTGTFDDIVLGFDTLEGYLKDHPFFGAIIGR